MEKTDLSRITILGAGFVGRALLRHFPDADSTRRQASSGARTHLFSLDDEATWRNPPLEGHRVVWTFPAAPLERVQAFHQACLTRVGTLVVLGSTSAYRLPSDGTEVHTVDEESPLDLDIPRVQGEEWLRAQGATILQLAGIFGPGREPEGWLRRGRIRDGAKIVNLIHVDDIVATIAHVLGHPLPGERINVANGEPLAWRDLVARLRESGRLPAGDDLPESTPRPHGKRVDNRRLRALLPGHVFLQA